MKLTKIALITLLCLCFGCTEGSQNGNSKSNIFKPGISQTDLIGTWDLKYIDLSEDHGVTWERYRPASDFLTLNADGTGAYGDPTGIGVGAHDMVWSLKGDSLFYHSPKWKAMDGETRARIVVCDADTLAFVEGDKSRFIYTKRK